MESVCHVVLYASEADNHVVSGNGLYESPRKHVCARSRQDACMRMYVVAARCDVVVVRSVDDSRS